MHSKSRNTPKRYTCNNRITVFLPVIYWNWPSSRRIVKASPGFTCTRITCGETKQHFIWLHLSHARMHTHTCTHTQILWTPNGLVLHKNKSYPISWFRAFLWRQHCQRQEQATSCPTQLSAIGQALPACLEYGQQIKTLAMSPQLLSGQNSIKTGISYKINMKN